MIFREFKQLLATHFSSMIAESETFFLVNIDKEKVWDIYLNSFPEDERQGHNCNACRQFLKAYSGMVSIKGNKTISIWDFGCSSKLYEPIRKALSEYVHSCTISDIFISDTQKLGCECNHAQGEDGSVITWHHLSLKVPNNPNFIAPKGESIDSIKGQVRSSKEVFQRALKEITPDAVDTVLDLIGQETLYRGEEAKAKLEEFKSLQNGYYKLTSEEEKNNFCWANCRKSQSISHIRNSAIGTLLVDLSTDRDLNEALTAYERVVAPNNYHRPKAVFSEKQVEQAQTKVEELGLTDALPRRHASIQDITVNNVIFANRDARKAMNPFEQLATKVPVNQKSLDKVEEISIGDFIQNVVPTASSISVLFGNTNIPNLMTLTAPVNRETPNLFKWNNGFAWSYKGGVTDSLKEKVAAVGGKVDEVLRCSLGWFNYDDLDIHVMEPNDNHIFFGHRKSATSGCLDVDMNAGHGTTRKPVENIIWTDKSCMKEGVYTLYIHQYLQREKGDFGFEVEIECGQQLLHFSYTNRMVTNDRVLVAKFKYSKKTGIEIIEALPSSNTPKEVWGVSTGNFVPVSLLMMSPNYWDEQKIGLRHYFFIMEGCKNPDPVRGFFNEYLRADLHDHKRVFEALGEQVKSPYREDQLSGLGFTVGAENSIVVKVEGSFTRVLKINF